METRITQAWFPARGLHLNRFFPPHLAHGFQPPFSPAPLLRGPEELTAEAIPGAVFTVRLFSAWGKY